MNHSVKLISIVLFSFLHLSASFAQTHDIDSIRQSLKNKNDDTGKINTLNSLSEKLERTGDFDTSEFYANSALALSAKLAYTHGTADAYTNLGLIYRGRGNNTKAADYINKALDLYRQIGEKSGIGVCIAYLGTIYDNQSNYPKALDYMLQALNLFQEIGDKYRSAGIIGNIGLVYYDEGNYSKALEYMFKALAIKQQLGRKKDIVNLFNNIGLIYEQQGNYSRALEFDFKALALLENSNNKEGTAACLGNIGIVFNEQENYPKALEYDNKALVINKEIGDKAGESTNLSNIGSIYYSQNDYVKALNYYYEALQINEVIDYKNGITLDLADIGGIYGHQGDYSRALDFFHKALKINMDIDYKSGIANNLGNIGLIYVKQKNFNQAKTYLDSALSISLRIGEKDEIRDIYENMVKLDSLTGNYKKGLEDYKKYIIYRDSLINAENTKKSVQAEMNFDFEQKQAAEKAAQDKKDAVAEQERNKQKVIRNSFIAGFSLTLILAFFIFRGYRQKQKANEIISQQKTIVEEKQKEILDSIHYAQRIQKALLASDALLSKNLPEYFVMYKPKDIVSGDFYWATKKDNRFYLAVCDSTGHGVPGAFMSLLNISFLNEAITEKSITQPNEVFDHVRKRLIENISQDGGQDGMDGVLASLYPSEGGTLLMYAAAYNSPVVIRNGSIIELSADKMPIGASPKQNESFVHREFLLQKGDIVYLFTDGYSDQFGGNKGKKFKYAQLQEKLLAISHQPLAEQKDILEETFDRWKGMLEQVDDILVMGIRV